MQELLKGLGELFVELSKQPSTALDTLNKSLAELLEVAQAIMAAQHSFFLFMVTAFFCILSLPIIVRLLRCYRRIRQYKQILGAETWKNRHRLRWYIPSGTVVVQDYQRHPSMSLVFLKDGEEAADKARLINTQEDFNRYLHFKQTMHEFESAVVACIGFAFLFLYMIFIG